MEDPKPGEEYFAIIGTNMQAPDSVPGSTDSVMDAIAPAKDAASGVLEQVKDQASSIVGQAKDQASSIADQVKEKAVTALTDQKEGLADRIDDLAQSVHKSGEHFAGQQDWIASAIERGATELGSLASTLRDNDVAGLIGQVKSLAKRQPALFIGASLAAGFAIARLGKLIAADVSHDDLPTLPAVGHAGR